MDKYESVTKSMKSVQRTKCVEKYKKVVKKYEHTKKSKTNWNVAKIKWNVYGKYEMFSKLGGNALSSGSSTNNSKFCRNTRPHIFLGTHLDMAFFTTFQHKMDMVYQQGLQYQGSQGSQRKVARETPASPRHPESLLGVSTVLVWVHWSRYCFTVYLNASGS